MYDFNYNFIKQDFNAELLFTDMNSLTYEILMKVSIATEFDKFKDILFNKKNY